VIAPATKEFTSNNPHLPIRIQLDVFPKYVMKINKERELNEIKFFYSSKALYENILYEWGKGEIVVQSYIKPKSKQVSLLRYEVRANNQIKAYTLLNQFDISQFPYLNSADILTFGKESSKVEKDEDASEFFYFIIRSY